MPQLWALLEFMEEGDTDETERMFCTTDVYNVRVKQHYGGRVPRGTPGITVLPWVGVSHKLVNPWVGVSHKPVNPWVGVSHKQVVTWLVLDT